jgi:hypothetical protein
VKVLAHPVRADSVDEMRQLLADYPGIRRLAGSVTATIGGTILAFTIAYAAGIFLIVMGCVGARCRVGARAVDHGRRLAVGEAEEVLESRAAVVRPA